jgi:hypothetical protein
MLISALRYLSLFFLLSIAWTWPLATRLSTRLAHDSGDPVLNAWILWWNTRALPFTTDWWNPEIFYPAAGALALSEHLFGLAILTAPMHAAGLNAAAAYNGALILTSCLSGYFAFLLGRQLTGSALGGLVCGVAFAFAPYRAGQLAHLQVLAAQWMPLTLYAMHRYVADGRRAWLVVVAVAWLLQALSNGYYLLFFPVLIGGWLLWFGSLRQKAELLMTFAAASVLLLPTLLKYQEVHANFGLRRNVGEMLMFSAQPSSFLQIPALLAFWPETRGQTPEGHLFPGLTVVVLVILGAITVIRRRQVADVVRRWSTALFYTFAAMLFWWLSFGPVAADAGVGAILLHPYTWLTWLPGFEGLRVPARFAMLAALCIAVAAGIAAARLLGLVPQRSARAGLALLVIAGTLADGWLEPMPLVPLPSRFRLPDVQNAVVLELPFDDPLIGAAAMYRSISHRRPLINGYSGHFPPHHALLARALRRGDPTALRFFAAGRPLVVLVHRAHDQNRRWRELVEGVGGVIQEESGLGPVFVIPPHPAVQVPFSGTILPSTPVPAPGGYAAVDLGAQRVVRGIEFDLGERYEDVAPRSRIEVSPDGTTWALAWEGWTGAFALAGTLEDQRRAPLRIPLPDLSARYVRIRPAPPWVADAIRVIGVR